MSAKPAVSLVAVAGRRKATLDLAQRLEHEGFTGIYCPSPGDGLALCEALALVTREIPFGTSIANIYTRHAFDYAQTAAVIHELSGGRFRFGVGVSHGPTHQRLSLRVGKPLEDIRKFVADVRAARKPGGHAAADRARHAAQAHGRAVGRDRAGRGVGQRRALAHGGVAARPCPTPRRDDPTFFIGDMVPTCIDDDRAAAAAVNRRTLTSYVKLPNYQNYWIEAGYEDEMLAIRAAIARREDDKIPSLMSDRWLRDVTLFGPASRGARGRRGLARGRGEDGHPGAVLDARRPDEGVRGADRRVSLAPRRRVLRYCAVRDPIREGGHACFVSRFSPSCSSGSWRPRPPSIRSGP